MEPARAVGAVCGVGPWGHWVSGVSWGAGVSGGIWGW